MLALIVEHIAISKNDCSAYHQQVHHVNDTSPFPSCSRSVLVRMIVLKLPARFIVFHCVDEHLFHAVLASSSRLECSDCAYGPSECIIASL